MRTMNWLLTCLCGASGLVTFSLACEETAPSSSLPVIYKDVIKTVARDPMVAWFCPLRSLVGSSSPEGPDPWRYRGGGGRSIKAKAAATSKSEKGAYILGMDSFWSKGVLQVHSNYLQLFWEISKLTVRILAPVCLLLAVGILAFPAPTTALKSFLEVWLCHLQRTINHATLLPLFVYSIIREGWTTTDNTPFTTMSGDYNEAFEHAGLPVWSALISRPIVDALLFRVIIKAAWDKSETFLRHHIKPLSSTMTKEDEMPSQETSLRWTILSSILYALSNLGTSLPPPSPRILRAQIVHTLQTGELYFLGMSLYRSHWNQAVVEQLLSSQPLILAVGNGVIHGILSWGLLCPLYQLYGYMASVGAQVAWSIFAFSHVDTQILIRLFGRIFLPWSTSTSSLSTEKDGDVPSSLRAISIVRPIFDAIVFRWGIKSIWLWWTLQQQERQLLRPRFSNPFNDVLSCPWMVQHPTNSLEFPKGQSQNSWMIWSSILFALSHLLRPTTRRRVGGSDCTIRKGGLYRFVFPWFRREGTSPLGQTVLRMVLHTVWSYSLLCPVYERQGFWPSIGAQLLVWGFLHMLRKGPSFATAAVSKLHHTNNVARQANQTLTEE